MASKTSYYWDACMFYEWLGAEVMSQAKKDAVQEILEENSKKTNIIVTSIISHLEVLPKKLSEKHFTDDHKFLNLFDAVHFYEQEINRNILLRAREIRDYYYRPGDKSGLGFKMMDANDAIHLATASVLACTEFHTRDNESNKSKVPLVSLYAWSGNPLLAGKYSLKIVSPENPQSSLPFGHHAQAAPAQPSTK